MSNEFVSKEELEKERTPSELWDWYIEKVNQICASEEGRRAFRLQNDKEKHIKKLVEEVGPLAIFGKHKFGDTEQILLLPVIGSQNYDAKVIDKRTEPATETYVEITQAHEGEDNYWRRCELLKECYVFLKAPVIKKGKGKSLTVSIPPAATSVEERVQSEMNRIRDAAERKVGKGYPANTALIISFDDMPPFEKALEIMGDTYGR